jgi:excisionase family DNA binding protein
MSDRLLTASEIAEVLSMEEGWVRRHTRGGLIPHVRLGPKYVRYRLDAVLRWVEEQEVGGAAWGKHRPKPSAGRGGASSRKSTRPAEVKS